MHRAEYINKVSLVFVPMLMALQRDASIISGLRASRSGLRNHFETIGGYNFVKEFKIGVNSLHLLRA